MEKHFCGDILIDMAVFTEAEKCFVDNFEVESVISKKECCKDEVEFIKGQDKLKKTTFEDLSVDQQVFIATLGYSYIHMFESLPKLVNSHTDYSPPKLVADIYVLDQVFLI